MQITARTPYARGVDTLMYVGDDGSAGSVTVLGTLDFAVIAISALLAKRGKRTRAAVTAAGICAAYNLATGYSGR